MPETRLTVNGKPAAVEGPPERSLLEALREDLQLTGTKYGCGEGQCGACSVHLDGGCEKSCQISVGDTSGRDVTTIEGIAGDGELSTVQQVFLRYAAFQCGYCTAGMIMRATALLRENDDPSDDEITDAMNGNVCRCGGYVTQRAAIREAAKIMREGK